MQLVVAEEEEEDQNERGRARENERGERERTRGRARGGLASTSHLFKASGLFPFLSRVRLRSHGLPWRPPSQAVYKYGGQGHEVRYDEAREGVSRDTR